MINFSEFQCLIYSSLFSLCVLGKEFFTLKCPISLKSQEVALSVFQRHISQGRLLLLLLLFPCTLTNVSFALSRANVLQLYINDSKIWISKWLELLIFCTSQNFLFWEVAISVTWIFFGFSHQIMQLKLLANCIKYQVILIHLGIILLFFERKCL